MTSSTCMRRLLSLSVFLTLASLCSAGIAVSKISRESATDRPGKDFAHHTLPTADPQLCEKECVANQQCLAYTYVRPGVQGPEAVCWLKASAPPAVSNSCCVSGRKGLLGALPPAHRKPVAAVGADGQPLPPGASGLAQCKLGGAKCPKRMRAAFDDDQGCICVD